ncbi:hypothetical protein E2542_SST27144 [Spatholobus suberectus]|nr:hypothetical protein E2542_SST27144 [Spatholobus suberectus]
MRVRAGRKKGDAVVLLSCGGGARMRRGCRQWCGASRSDGVVTVGVVRGCPHTRRGCRGRQWAAVSLRLAGSVECGWVRATVMPQFACEAAAEVGGLRMHRSLADGVVAGNSDVCTVASPGR